MSGVEREVGGYDLHDLLVMRTERRQKRQQDDLLQIWGRVVVESRVRLGIGYKGKEGEVITHSLWYPRPRRCPLGYSDELEKGS